MVPQRDRKLYGIVKSGREVSACRGERLYGAGEPADELFVVRSGYVRLTLPEDGDRRPRTVAVAGPDELFGVDAVLSSTRRVFTATAGEDVTAVGVPGPRTLRAIRNTTWTLSLLVRSLHRDLARARWSGPGSGGPTTDRRLADLLAELAGRLGVPGEGGVRIPHWFTHQELADLIGGHRSTVTTRINEWIYAGLLEEDDHALVVRDPDGLHAAGSGREGWLGSVDPSSP